jgi:hypothetical protein
MIVFILGEFIPWDYFLYKFGNFASGDLGKKFIPMNKGNLNRLYILYKLIRKKVMARRGMTDPCQLAPLLYKGKQANCLEMITPTLNKWR